MPARLLPPGPPLGRLFRGKYLALLRHAYDSGRLTFHGSLRELREPSPSLGFSPPSASKKEWVVYAKPPFGSPQLERCRAFLGSGPLAVPAPLDPEKAPSEPATGADVEPGLPRCPVCRVGHFRRIQILAPTSQIGDPPPVQDSS